MKPLVSLIVGMVIGAAAVSSLADAQGKFNAFQFVDRGTYVEKYPADAKSVYLEGPFIWKDWQMPSATSAQKTPSVRSSRNASETRKWPASFIFTRR